MGRYISNSFGSCKGGYVSPFTSATVPVDPDAQAFILAANITDPTEQTAINNLVIYLKQYSLWSKLIAFYPFVGSSSSSFSYNLKNPAQYQITWYGGLTFSSTGLLGNGTNGYGDTGINELSVCTLNDFSMSCYVRTSFTNELTALGVFDGSNSTFISPKYLSTYYTSVQNAGFPTVGSPSSQGLFTVSRSVAGTFDAYKNSGLESSPLVSSTALCNLNFYIMALNFNNTTINYAAFEVASIHLATSFNATDVSNFYTGVQNFQTTLGRNV